TTPDDPSRAVMDGIRRILNEHSIAPADVEAVIHGTTLVANALIERKGVKTGLITTRGFRDVLEIGREWRYDLFDLAIEMPTPIAERAARAEITERLDADGNVLTPLALDELDDIAAAFQATDVQSIAVCLLHAYRNPAHELAIKNRLAEIAPDLSVSLSSVVSAEMGEYERSSTTVADAYVHPIFKRYVERLVDGLAEMAIGCDLLLVLSDGRTVRHDTATEFPIRLVQSGPAAGAQAAVLYGGVSGEHDLLCFDMGGTTAKACLIENGEPQRSASFEVARVFRFAEGSGLPLQIPAIDMIEIGAGGGSIARIDRLGLIQVGPDSAGSDPGPVCYGKGGTEPTVTDADLILGYLDADSFLGGAMHLDKSAAIEAIRTKLADPLGISVEDAAWGIHETVTGNMAQAAAIHAIEKGLNIARFKMVPIGGAGPVHACSLAQKMGIDRLICPLGAGVASAIGMLGSPISFEFAQTNMARLDAVDWREIAALTDQLTDRGRELVRNAGVSVPDITVRYGAMMRYVGQGYEVEAPIEESAIRTGDNAAIKAAFEASYRQRFGRTEDMPPEVITWRVVVSGPRPPLLDAISGTENTSRTFDAPQAKGSRAVWFGTDSGFIETPVIDRYGLQPATKLDGPNMIEEVESTLILPPGFTAEVDNARNLIISAE
ncbi:MAG: hydantoinase/oxoprolinase family protein, partial [Alphaproteobacteria bacterium]|nr:hydantoinase/oxoprolinase family protein [Alphaproteobacteria bacterium]